jgi:Ca2+ transporting ATPase
MITLAFSVKQMLVD